MTTAPPIRKKRELLDALTHIAYEVEALDRAATRFARYSRRFDLEAALLHARNVTEFCWAPSKKHPTHKDGVYAVHYVAAKRWKRLRASFSQRPNEKYAAICAQTLHVSVNRDRVRTQR